MGPLDWDRAARSRFVIFKEGRFHNSLRRPLSLLATGKTVFVRITPWSLDCSGNYAKAAQDFKCARNSQGVKMDHQNVFTMIAFSLLLGIPFLILYTRNMKHSSHLGWKSCTLWFLIAYGGTFVAAFVLARITDPLSYAMGHAFLFDVQTSAVTAKTAVILIAASLGFLSFHILVRKRT